MRKLDRKLALQTSQAFFTVIGGVGSVAYVAAFHSWLTIAALGIGGFAWFVLYKTLEGWQTRNESRMYPVSHPIPD